MVNQSDISGNFIDSNGEIKNIIDILLAKGATATPLYGDKANTLNRQPAITGNMVAGDGKVYNIVDILQNMSGGGSTIPNANQIPTEDGGNVQEKLNTLSSESEVYEQDISTLNATTSNIISGSYVGASDASIQLTKSEQGVQFAVDIFGVDFGAENAGKTLKVGSSGFLELTE